MNKYAAKSVVDPAEVLIQQISDESNDEPVGRHRLEFIDTPSSRVILEVENYCLEHGEIGTVVGAPGVGKSTASRYFAGKHRSRTYYLEADPERRQTRELLLKLASRVWRYDYAGSSTAGLFDDLSRVLREDRNRLIIIDECQLLSLTCLESLRCLHDASGVGLVLLGNPKTFRKMEARQSDFAQLLSRVSMRRVIDGLLPGDLEAVANAYGVCGAEELAVLKSIADRPVLALRGVVRVLERAKAFAEKQGSKAISAELLCGVIQYLGLLFVEEV